MGVVKFRTKFKETANALGEPTIAASVPTIESRHIDRDSFSRDPRYGFMVNSDLLTATINSIIQRTFKAKRIIRDATYPEVGIEFVEEGFFTTVIVTIPTTTRAHWTVP